MKLSMRISKQIFSVFIIVGLVLSCSKDGNDGAVGPQGAQGEQGPAGPQGQNGVDGADGTDGTDGETGTANVIFSDWILADYLNPNSVPQNIMGLATLSASEFNIAADLIIVYAGNNVLGDSAEIFQLPYTHDQNLVFGFGLFGNGNGSTLLRIQVNTIDGSNSTFSYIDRYRYIIIPGGVSVSGKSSSSFDYSKMAYEEILAHFNIPE
mgnify:CR=1 FL=1